MKKWNILYISSVLSAMTMLAVFTSCKKDLSSRELLVYLKGDIAGTATFTQTIPFVHTPVSVEGTTLIDVAAYASREVPADIDITITPDLAKTDAYNTMYNTTKLPVPADAFRVVNGNKHKLTAGELESAPIQIEITRPEILTHPGGYLLPLTITAVESRDKGVRISSTHATVYLNITYEFNNVQQNQTPLTGTLMSRTGWSVTVSNTTSGALGPAMLDGNNSTAWRSSNSSTAAKNYILNMGSVQTVKGFQIVPNYVATAENATRMTLSTSTDNTTWTVQGIWNGTGPASGSSAASPDIKGVNFIAPVTARYFRFDINTWVSGNRVGVAELNAVQ